MLDGFPKLALFFEGESKDRVRIWIVGPDQQGSSEMLDRSVEFAFLKRRTPESVTSKKIIRSYCHGLLEMNNCFVDLLVPPQGIAQRHLSVRIVWLHGQRPLAMQ